MAEALLTSSQYHGIRIETFWYQGLCMEKKIAFISDHASPLAILGGTDSGGQNVYVAQTAIELAALGYQVDVFTRWEDATLPKIYDWKPGVRVIHIKAGPVEYIPKENLLELMDEFSQNMLSFIKDHQQQYLLIHAHFFMSALVADFIKKATGIPYVVTFHALGIIRRIYQGNDDKFPRQRIDIEKMIVKNADRIIAECPQDRKDLVHFYDAKDSNISVVPCGFSPLEFFPVDKKLARQKLGLDPEEKILLQLGRMVPRKGIDNVIRGISKLNELGTKCNLLIVGGDGEQADRKLTPEIGRLEDIAKEEGVEDQVIFAGNKSRDLLKYYYSAADLFITTPWYEPFGITPLESMACGTPVIGSDVGGIKYTVVNGKTGLLVPPNDPKSLALNINLVFNNVDWMESMRRHSVSRVNALFTWRNIAQMLSEAYETIQLSEFASHKTREEKKKNRAA
jgi:D-inositol-3-phosphate glycosyltransferase